MLNTTRLRLLSLNNNRKVLSYAYHVSSTFGKKKPMTIKTLIDDIENSNQSSGLDNLVKNVQVQTKKLQKNKHIHKEFINKQKKKMDSFEKATIEKGQEFWFPEKNEIIREQEESGAETVAEDENVKQQYTIDDAIVAELEDYSEQNSHDILQLKEKIETDGSNREVSRLMTAMIDRIDQDADDIEQNFQQLIKAFSANEAKMQRFDGKQRSNFESKHRKSGFSRKGTSNKTFFDAPTTLFKNISVGETINELCDEVSYFESKWKEELQSVLPEVKPKNAFEVKMLDFEHEWKFPIDNEQDMGIEETTGFDEHVFLEHLLEEFPEEGPVYKFMELVITGLQQNPYLSVEEKTNQVLWFKEYFDKFSEDDFKVANLGF